MSRKFADLSATEQNQFMQLADYIQESKSDDVNVKINLVKRFVLDLNDPVVFDFITGVPVQNETEEITPAVQQTPDTELNVEPIARLKGKDLTYANSEDLIIIQNRLLHAISHLTLNERRLILFLSPIVRQEVSADETVKRFKVRAIDFANEYNLKKENSYKVLEKVADTILEKAFWFWNFKDNDLFGKKGYKTGLSWVTKCDYLKTQGEIAVELHEDVIEMLTIFDKSTGYYWTKYQKEWITHLGTYGIIMLEMLLGSLENKGYYTIEYLREKFGCVDNYPKFGNFKIWVIDKAIKEIEENTPIRVTFTQHKQGRSVTGLTFSYTDTSTKTIKEKQQASGAVTDPFANFKMTPKQLSMFAAKIKKASGQDVDDIIAELSNVHLQGKHVAFLKVLDYVPSEWYSEEEIQSHLTAEQLASQQASAKARIQEDKQAKLKQLEQDFDKLLAHAELFVIANHNRVNKNGIERLYFEQGKYTDLMMVWKPALLDEQTRRHFEMVDKILSL
ncbi:RepB family plasmid replication initiator protein [Moraxella sp. ZJ142]|uniref:RepB family plasmid replication initiator protein n=1 Tax=Moraxella marmotae TaxID=3344520 RepID=UPI0035D4B476